MSEFNDMFLNMVRSNQFNRSYELVSFDLRQRSGYNNMFYSPMSSDFSDRESVDRICNLQERNIFRSAEFSDLACSVLKPKLGSSSSQASIANGWGESRSMFIMTIRDSQAKNSHDTYLKYVFVGFTDSCDVSLQSKHLSPSTRFTLNHVFTFRVSQQAGFGGNTMSNTTLLSSHQIFSKNYSHKDTFRDDPTVFGVRPGDIFANITTSGITQGAAFGMDSTDDRYELSSRQNTLTFSDRAMNNNPSSYLSKTLNAIKQATTAEMGGDEYSNRYMSSEEEVIDMAYSHASERDSSISGSIKTGGEQFLRDINKSKGYSSRGFIEFRDLIDMFPEIDKLTRVSLIPSQKLNSVKQLIANMQGFGSKTKQTEIALLLGYAIPTYMLKCGIMEYGFTSTNDLRSSAAGTTGFKTMTSMSDNGIYSVTPTMFDPGIDVGSALNKLHTDIEMELLRAVSHQCGVKLSVEVACSLCGDTVIKIWWGNEPMEEFIIPTFCDMLFGPMATKNKQDLNDISSDFYGLSMHMGGSDMAELYIGNDSPYKSSNEFSAPNGFGNSTFGSNDNSFGSNTKLGENGNDLFGNL